MRAGVLLLLLLFAIASGAGAAPQIDAGGFHGVALKADGTVLTWGDDSAGQLGIGRTLGSTTPLRVRKIAERRPPIVAPTPEE